MSLEKSELIQRLEQAIAHSGLSQRQVELRSGLSEGYFYYPLRGYRTKLGYDTLSKIAKTCGVNVGWLVSGEGEMADKYTYQSPVADEEQDSSRTAVHRLIGSGRTAIMPGTKRPSDDAAINTLETALSSAFDNQRHHIRDGDAVRAVLSRGVRTELLESDPVELARIWLDAAAALRTASLPVTVETLLIRVTEDLFGRRNSGVGSHRNDRTPG